jgi:hypothetical protein
VRNSSINIIYLNILLILGIVLCLYAPILFYSFTGVNIFNYSSITDSVYSMSLFNFRICCATVFLHLLIYLFVLNQNRLKLSIFNKPISLAATIIIKGGFEGLGDPSLDEQNVSSKYMRTLNSSKFTDLGVETARSLSATQKESPTKESSGTLTRLNPEVIPHPPEGSYAGSYEERSTSSAYPY